MTGERAKTCGAANLGIINGCHEDPTRFAMKRDPGVQDESTRMPYGGETRGQCV